MEGHLPIHPTHRDNNLTYYTRAFWTSVDSSEASIHLSSKTQLLNTWTSKCWFELFDIYLSVCLPESQKKEVYHPRVLSFLGRCEQAWEAKFMDNLYFEGKTLKLIHFHAQSSMLKKEACFPEGFCIVDTMKHLIWYPRASLNPVTVWSPNLLLNPFWAGLSVLWRLNISLSTT